MSVAGRVAYRDELVRIAQNDDSIVCLEADLGGAKHPFQQAFPKRFFNLGIAEAAAVDVATALASNGYTPFFSTFAPFAVLRAAESIKLSLGYMGANIKIVAPYTGVSGGWFGTTHHCLEDVAIMQAFPGIRILSPYGEGETRDMVRMMATTPGPFYMRLGRNGAYDSLTEQRDENGIIWQGPADTGLDSLCVVSIGEMATTITLDAHQQRSRFVHANLCMLDLDALRLAASSISARYRTVLVVEEHRPLGSIASTLALLMPDCRVFSFNCGNAWPHTGGTHEDVLETLGFSVHRLLELIDRVSPIPEPL